jgi:hypothetical protein
LAFGGFVIYGNYGIQDTTAIMDFIESRLRGSGTFADYDGSIGIESAEDLGWWKKGENWYVMYGKLQLKFTPERLQDQEFLKKIGSIGLDIRGDLEEGKLSFYWFGTKLKEWVPQ